MEQCLTDLIAVKSLCETPETTPAVWLDNIEGINRGSLTNLSSTMYPTADALAAKLISGAAQELATDIETLIPKSYSLRNSISNTCSTCTLQPLYGTGQNGILIKEVSQSPYALLSLDSLKVLVNNTGTFNIVITDGVVPRIITVDLTAGVVQPIINIGYKTMESTVRVYFEDFNTVSVATVLCESTGGCGCGRRDLNPLKNGFVVTGLFAGVENTTQYGFVPCVSIACSYDAIMCTLINMSPRAFGAALMYKAASKFFMESRMSERNNRTAGYDNDQKEDLVLKYETLYKEMLYGGEVRKGISDMINTNLGFISDRCVECRNKIGVSYAHG